MDERDLTALKNKYDIVGNDPALNRALRVAVTVAPADDLTVLICGESGSGKDVLPKIIHQNSPRKNGKYFAVNCGAIAEGTIDSELFGHEKGAFTGAVETRKGYFEEADGGTLFLDEVGELPLASQAKLLRVLQSGEFIRVGSSKVLKTNVRVIAATNRNLMHAVSTGKFRPDLYYRINTIQIDLPPLRDRREDIPLLFRKFAADFTDKYSRTGVRLTDEAAALLMAYRWPGNIRQLKSIAETVSMLETARMAPGHERVEISAATISRYIPKDETNTLPVPAGPGDDRMTGDEKEIIIKMILSLKQDVDALKSRIYGQDTPPEQPRALLKPAGRDIPGGIGADEQPDEQDGWQDAAPDAGFNLSESKDERIRRALREYPTKKAAADALGISERSLYRWIKNHPEADINNQ